jgi:hypothetical protein
VKWIVFEESSKDYDDICLEDNYGLKIVKNDWEKVEVNSLMKV